MKAKAATVTTFAEATLPTTVDKLYVINLKSRPDRRREILSELAQIRLDADSPVVEMFCAVKPDTADTFPSIGARGCFLSHLGVLRQAREAGHHVILILEDDAALTPGFISQISSVMNDLTTMEWSLAYLGPRIAPECIPGADLARTDHWRELPPDVGIQTTHAMLVHERAIDLLIDYLERMMARPSGHPDGGPMHVDGAYSWFRRAHPELLTVVTPQPYVGQRSSKSDIATQTWKEKLPFVSLLRQLRNRLR